MKKQIPNIIPFPFDAQSSPFFCALATTLIPVLGYTEETPYFCPPKGSDCVGCGDCKKSTLQKHHLQLYHDYQTFTGVSFGWAWPELDSDYHTIENAGARWRWPDEFIGFIMGHAGLAWRRLSKDAGQDSIYQAITASVDAGFPVIMKLGAGQDWHVVTGYEDDILYALCYKKDKPFTMPNWFNIFEDAIIITGRSEPSVTLPDILRRITAVLEHPAHAKLEKEVNRRIDQMTKDNMTATAEWLNGIASFPIEARWHAAETFTSGENAVNGILRMTDNKAVKELFGRIFFSYIADNNDETHGILWKVWGLLGVGPKTHYSLPGKRKVIKLLSRHDTGNELKRLFAIVFHNDREVLKFLREALSLIQTT
ncbi:MAG: hypothetical protein FWF08_00330 [Oscillospiraceae bacterium]|nr:hypothetical protein [Oscillospiraceae bacterium]